MYSGPSIWLLASSAIGTVLSSISDVFIPVPAPSSFLARLTAVPVPNLAGIATLLYVLGFFIDIPVFLLCLGALFAWKAVWFVVRIYRIALELIPMMG